jgi:hypothetical protein
LYCFAIIPELNIACLGDHSVFVAGRFSFRFDLSPFFLHAINTLNDKQKRGSMDLLTRLNLATLTAQKEDDLPDFLAARIYAVAQQLTSSHDLQNEIAELIEQLSLYDTYGQTGYIGMGVNNYILEGTIVRLEAKLLESVHRTKE